MDVTQETIDYAKKRWDRARSKGDLGPMALAGNDLEELVDELYAALEKSRDGIRPGETYTAAGLPRNAAARARSHGAKIKHLFSGDEFIVEFPDGTGVTAMTVSAAKRRGKTPGTITTQNRNALSQLPPLGDTLEAVLNAFADREEGKS